MSFWCLLVPQSHAGARNHSLLVGIQKHEKHNQQKPPGGTASGLMNDQAYALLSKKVSWTRTFADL